MRTLKCASVSVILCLILIFGMVVETALAESETTRKIVRVPADQEILIGSGKELMSLSIQPVLPEGWTCDWTVEGIGALAEGEGPTTTYKIPATIAEKSIRVVITATLKDPQGKAQDPIKSEFTLVKSSPDMSTGTKIAISAGAVAAVGGGIALAVNNNNKSDNETSLEVRIESLSGGNNVVAYICPSNWGETGCEWKQTYSLHPVPDDKYSIGLQAQLNRSAPVQATLRIKTHADERVFYDCIFPPDPDDADGYSGGWMATIDYPAGIINIVNSSVSCSRIN